MRMLLLSAMALLALTLTGLAGFWWLGGHDAHRWLAGRLLEAALDREAHVDGGLKLELGAEPLLEVTGIRIDSPAWAARPSMIQIERAAVRVALRPLLQGSLVLPRLALAGVTVNLEIAADGRQSWDVNEGRTASTPSRLENLVLPIIEDLSISNAKVNFRDQRTGRQTSYYLESLTSRPDPVSGAMRLDASGDINNKPFRLAGSLGSLEMALTATEPYPIELDLQLPAVMATLTGTIVEVTRAQGIDLHLEAHSPSLRAAVAAWDLDVPVDARVTSSAELTGDLDRLALSEFRAELSNADGDRMEMSGTLADLWEGRALDGRLSASFDPAGDFGRLLPEDWRLLDRIEAAARVAGSLSSPTFDDISAEVRGPGESRLTLTGHLRLATASAVRLAGLDLTSTFVVPDPAAFTSLLGFDPSPLGGLRGTAVLSLANENIDAVRLEIDAPDFGGLRLEGGGRVATVDDRRSFSFEPDLDLSANMAASAPLLALIDGRIPAPGPLDATSRFRRDDLGYRFDDLELNLGDTGGPTLSAQGSIGSVAADHAGATSVDLAVRFGLPSSQLLRPFVRPDLPELGRVEGGFELGGTVASLRIANARMEINSKAGVVVTATGGIADVRTTPPVMVDGIAFQVEARAPSTKVAARMFGYEAPELGPVRMRSDLTGDQGAIALSAVQLIAGSRAEPVVAITGSIGDLLALQKIQLESRFKIPTKDLLAFANIFSKSGIGSVSGVIDLSDADGSIGVEHLEAEVRETNLLSFKLKGLIDDLKNLDQASFETTLQIPSIAKLADVFEAGAAGLGAFRFDGKMSGDHRGFNADGRAVLGKTRITGVLTGDLRGARPSFAGRLHSPRLELADIGLTPQAFDDASTRTRAPSAGRRRLFRDDPLPIEGLRRFDLDLDVQIDDVAGVAVAIDEAAVQLALTNGLLKLTSLRFASVGGYAQVHGTLDLRRSVPAWRVHAEADDVRVGDLWRQLHVNVPLRGELDLLLDLYATGRSPRQLASSLTGDLSFALQRGRLDSRLFDLTTMNPLHWLVAPSTRRGYSEVNCFFMKMHANKGVANVRALALDTSNAFATGEGDIDLTRERMNLRIVPRAKRSQLVGLATPFAIRGDLAHPVVQVSATGGVARAVGRIALTPVQLLESLLPFVNDLGRDQANPCLNLAEAKARRP